MGGAQRLTVNSGEEPENPARVRGKGGARVRRRGAGGDMEEDECLTELGFCLTSPAAAAAHPSAGRWSAAVGAAPRCRCILRG